MIQRIVLLKLDETHATDDGRAAVAAHSRKVLEALPGVRDVVVGTPADPASEKDWDISLVLGFSSAADLEPYRTHPDHRRFVDEYLKPQLACIRAWNFHVQEPGD